MTTNSKTPWPHAPLHKISSTGTYFVTAGTYGKQHFFEHEEGLRVLQRGLLSLAQRFNWRLEAWAIFSNHYHFVAHAEEPSNLPLMLSLFHEKTAKWINQLDDTPGRKVWHNFWDTRLTYEKSYMARLKYVHQNPVHHRLVNAASAYPWCSARWFERVAEPAQVKTIYSFKIDKLKIDDDY